MSTPPNETTSVDRKPERLPEPYLISKVVPFSYRNRTGILMTWGNINLIGGGAASVVLVVEEASDVGEVALLAGDPEVAGPGVKHNLE